MVPHVAYPSNGSTENMNVNGSVTPVAFFVNAPANTYFRVCRCIWRIEDSGTISSDTFGVITALSNGITVELHDGYGTTDDGDKIDDIIPAGHPVQKNSDIAALCYDLNSAPVVGTGTDLVTARWTFVNYSDGYLLGPDRRIRIEIADDLSGIAEFTIAFEGFKDGQEHPGVIVGSTAATSRFRAPNNQGSN